MNVCALDVVARTPDFESLAASLELRGWEWDLLHAADGLSSLGAIAQQLNIDNDSAIGFVHEAIHRGLLGVATMSVQAYRSRNPQNMLASPPQTPVLGSSTGATAVLAAPPAEAVESPKPGSISFSVNSFDWNEPHAPFEDTEEETPVAVTPATPGKTVTAHVGGVHYDERFGVEHPDGPFATTRDGVTEPIAPAIEPIDDEVAHPSVPKAAGIAAVAATVAGVTAAAFGSVVEAVTPKEKPAEDTSLVPEPEASVVEAPLIEEPATETIAPAPVVEDEPVAAAHQSTYVEDPFAAAPRHDEPFAAVEDPFAASEPVEDPFAVKPRAVEEPFAAKSDVVEDPFAAKPHTVDDPFTKSNASEVAHHDEPTAAASAPIAISIGEDDSFEPIVRHDEPLSANGHAASVVTDESEQPVEDSAPGSISFSFSSDDQFDSATRHEPAREAYEAPAVAAAPYVAPMPEPTFPEATTIEHHEVEKPKTPGETQSTFFEREAIDTDAGRELEEKAKTWKESLSWREQQQLNEAVETGKEKTGAINSLLRMLGVR